MGTLFIDSRFAVRTPTHSTVPVYGNCR